MHIADPRPTQHTHTCIMCNAMQLKITEMSGSASFRYDIDMPFSRSLALMLQWCIPCSTGYMYYWYTRLQTDHMLPESFIYRMRSRTHGCYTFAVQSITVWLCLDGALASAPKNSLVHFGNVVANANEFYIFNFSGISFRLIHLGWPTWIRSCSCREMLKIFSSLECEC